MKKHKMILAMLQKLQRKYVEKTSIFVSVTITDDKAIIVACTVFDNEGEAHYFSFHEFEDWEKCQEQYDNILTLIESL